MSCDGHGLHAGVVINARDRKGLELMERLAALVPPPRKNQVLYHGVLASRAAWRQEIVPQPKRSCRSDHEHARAINRPGLACPLCAQSMRLQAVVLPPSMTASSEHAGGHHSRGLLNEPWVPTR